MLKNWEQYYKTVVNLIYPSFCIHCEEKADNILCANCASLIELSNKHLEKRFSYLFENVGVMHSFFKEFKKNKLLKINKLLAAYAVVKLDQLNWQKFDLIVPYNINIYKRNNHTFNLAVEIAKFLEIPLKYKIKANQKVLVINDLISAEIIENIHKRQSTNIYCLGVCFDVSSNHLNLST